MAAARSIPASAARLAAAGRSNTLGLSRLALEEVHATLDAADSKVTRDDTRAYARVPVRGDAIAVCLEHPGGTTAELLMAGRNLSRGGVSLLHSGFVHAGTRCIVRLPLSSDLVASFPGEVVRCTHRGGQLHEIGVKFARPLEQELVQRAAAA